MELLDVIEALTRGESIIDSLRTLLQTMGIVAIVLALIGGLLFFAPTIIASMRHIKLRILICVLNVLAIVSIFMKPYIPIIIWAVIMILAISGKPEHSNQNSVPVIKIYSSKEEDN